MNKVQCCGHLKECDKEITLDRDGFPVDNSGCFTGAGRALCMECAEEFNKQIQQSMHHPVYCDCSMCDSTI